MKTSEILRQQLANREQVITTKTEAYRTEIEPGT